MPTAPTSNFMSTPAQLHTWGAHLCRPGQALPPTRALPPSSSRLQWRSCSSRSTHSLSRPRPFRGAHSSALPGPAGEGHEAPGAALDGSGRVGPGRGVVVTGGTRGLGLALASELVRGGDRLVICGRDEEQLRAAVGALQEERRKGEAGPAAVFGTVCDVGRPEDVQALGCFAQEKLGTVHFWFNNAGQVTSRKMLADVAPQDIVSAVSANVIGSLLGSREAVRIMRQQTTEAPCPSSSPAHTGPPYRIFNFGFSRWGAAFTQSSVTHKATKTALAQLNVSLAEELKKEGLSFITVHNLSPGMVLTDLLLRDSTPGSRRFFNALAEEPETVAAALVAQINAMPADCPSGTNIEYLSPLSALARVLSRLPQVVNGGRFFDKEGNRVPVPGLEYAPNGVRIQLPNPAKLRDPVC